MKREATITFDMCGTDEFTDDLASEINDGGE